MTNYTTSLRLALPTPGDPATNNLWGPPVNTNMQLIESAVTDLVQVSLQGLSSYSLTVADGIADQSRPLIQQYTGAPSGPCLVTMPNVQKAGWAVNSTTGGYAVTLTTGGGMTATMPADGYWRFFYCDGAGNVTRPDVGFMGLSAGSDGFSVSGPANLESTAVVGSTLAVASNTSIGGILTVNGASTFNNTLDVGGNVGLGAACSVTGNLGIGGGINQTGTGSTNTFAGTLACPGTTNLTVCNISSTFTIAGTILCTGGVLGTPGSLGVGGNANVGGSVNAAAFNIVSDYRLKTTFGMAEAGKLIDAIPVHDGAFKKEPRVRRPMFIAHEVQAVAPWAVRGHKDARDMTGAIVPQSVDISALIPVLWAEVKSLRQEIKELRALTPPAG